MNPVIYDEFKKLLDKLNQEKDDIQKEIGDNTLQIIEAQSYTKEILDREEEDFKVFSPRKIEDIYKDELQKSNMKQSDYEKRNQVLINRREELDSILFVLENVWEEIQVKQDCEELVDDKLDDGNLKEESEGKLEDNLQDKMNDQDNEDVEHKDKDEKENCETDDEGVTEYVIDDSKEKVIKDTVNKINHIAHKIDLSAKLIQQDPMRVKLELQAINNSMKSVMDNLCDILE